MTGASLTQNRLGNRYHGYRSCYRILLVVHPGPGTFHPVAAFILLQIRFWGAVLSSQLKGLPKKNGAPLSQGVGGGVVPFWALFLQWFRGH